MNLPRLSGNTIGKIGGFPQRKIKRYKIETRTDPGDTGNHVTPAGDFPRVPRVGKAAPAPGNCPLRGPSQVL